MMFTSQPKGPKVPASYFCSITNQIMIDPVVSADGYTYEREAISEWLKTHDTSPKTNLKLKHKELIDNHDKRGDILEFLDEHPEFYERDEVYLPKSWAERLTIGIKSKDSSVVQELLTRDRRLLTLKLEGDYTAFHLACEFGSSQLAELLLENLVKKNQLDKVMVKSPIGFKLIYLNALLQESLEKSDKTKFSLLLKLGAEVEQPEAYTQNTLLHRLVIQGNPEPISWLLEQKVALESRNGEGNTPLLLSVIHNHPELTDLLLKKGANPQLKNIQQESSVSIALLTHNIPMLSILVGPKKSTLPPLHLALELNEIEILKALLKQKSISIEALDEQERTPFFLTVERGNMEAVTLLLEKGTNPTTPCGIEKLTPLHVAAARGDLPTLKLLLQTQALAVIDAPNANGDTPLHLAAKSGQDAVIPLLLEAGASHKVKNYQDQTPIELAKKQPKPKTVNLIEQTARALKRAKLEEIGVLRQLAREQLMRIEQLEKTVQHEKTEHLVIVQELQEQTLKPLQQKVEVLEKEKLVIQQEQFLRLEQLEKAFRHEEKQRKELQEKLQIGKKVIISHFSNFKKMNKQVLKELLIKTLQGHTSYVSCLQLLPGGELVSSSYDSTIKVWDLQSGNCLKTLQEHTSTVYCLQLLPGGELVSGSTDNTIKVWDLKSGNCLKTLQGHTRHVRCLQLLPGGTLVSGSDDKTIKVWDLKGGNCLKTLQGHTDDVRCLQLLPGGTLVSGSDDNTIKVWDLQSGNCLKTLQGHTNEVRCLQLLPGGELVSGSEDNTIKVWDLTEFVKVLDEELEKQLSCAMQ